MEFLIALVTSPEFLKYILTFLFGGGIFTGLKVWADHKEFKQNAKIANMKAPVEIDALQVTGLEVLAKNLQSDNDVLRKDRDYWKGNYEMVREQVEKLSDELERQEANNHRLRMEVDGLRAKLNQAELNSPAAQSDRKGLREHADNTYVDDPGYTGE